jgi:hypothetical protein
MELNYYYGILKNYLLIHFYERISGGSCARAPTQTPKKIENIIIQLNTFSVIKIIFQNLNSE